MSLELIESGFFNVLFLCVELSWILLIIDINFNKLRFFEIMYCKLLMEDFVVVNYKCIKLCNVGYLYLLKLLRFLKIKFLIVFWIFDVRLVFFLIYDCNLEKKIKIYSIWFWLEL